MTELTESQTDQQDEVDNAIYECVNSIVPPEMLKRLAKNIPLEEGKITWDQNWIGEVRDSIFENLMRYHNIPEEEHDAMLMEFYPYLKE